MRGIKKHTGIIRQLVAGGALGIASLLSAQPSAPSTGAFIHPQILGAGSCSTSGCHGGAGEKSSQYVIWSQRDVHSRAYATLTTARSARLAEALRIPDPTTSARCTICHAPALTLPAEQLAPDVKATEGVSCASCHGPESGWLRSHTRTDYTHADRVAAGMRDLADLHVRANTCVACHQNIDSELVNTGLHPRLIFELGGQAASEPKHWRECAGWNGAQAWYVGQAVALREMSSALLTGKADAVHKSPRWEGLLWLLQRTGDRNTLPLGNLTPSKDASVYARAVTTCDQLAKTAAACFPPAQTSSFLSRLASTYSEFADRSISREMQACRAERLVLALDRLMTALPANQRPAGSGPLLDNLFRLVQSTPNFSPTDFSSALAAFAKTLPPTPAN